MTASEFVIDTQEKMGFLLKGLYELTISNQALLSVLQEHLPQIDYEKHHRAAMQSASAKQMLQLIRASDKSLERLKEGLNDQN